MRRALGWLGLALLGGGVAAVVVAYERVGAIRVEPVAGDVHVIFGTGGNVGVLGTEVGPVVVDTLMFRRVGESVRNQAEALVGGSIQVVLNTHYHGDHTHGNPGFVAGMPIVASSRTRELLLEKDADYWEGDHAAFLPGELVDERRVLRVGGKTIEALHPGRGHTGGDLVVRFVEDRVIHLGDLYFNGRYPRVDRGAGGSLEAWIATLDRVLELEFDHVIPGHGPVSDRAGLVAFQAFLREVWDAARESVAAGRDLEETLATVELTRAEGLEEIVVPFVVRIDRETFLGDAWREAEAARGTPRP